MLSSRSTIHLPERITRLSLSTWSGSAGLLLLSLSSGAYLMGTTGWNYLGFLYGSALLLGGLILKQTEFRPIPYREAPMAETLLLREQQATPCQLSLLRRLTRYHYQPDPALNELYQSLLTTDPQASLPQLMSLQETVIEGAYALVLEFASGQYSLADWQQRQHHLAQLWGSDHRLDLSQPQLGRIELILKTTKAPK